MYHIPNSLDFCRLVEGGSTRIKRAMEQELNVEKALTSSTKRMGVVLPNERANTPSRVTYMTECTYDYILCGPN